MMKNQPLFSKFKNLDLPQTKNKVTKKQLLQQRSLAYADDPVLRTFYGKPRVNPKKNQDFTRASFPTQRCHVDLFDFYGRKNRRVPLQKENNVRYGLVCVDCFSRYAWVIGLPNKTAKTTLQGFVRLLNLMRPFRKQMTNWQSTLFFSDKGLEFCNPLLRKFLEVENKHKLLNVASESGKAYLAERFIRTYRSLLAVLVRKIQHRTGSDVVKTGWKTINDVILSSYNATAHAAFGNRFSPLQVAHLNPEALDYINNKKFAHTQVSPDGLMNKVAKVSKIWPIHVGDVVRKVLSNKEKLFVKKSEMPKIGTALYRVRGLRAPLWNLDKNPLVYLETLDGKKIHGVHRMDMLVKVDPISKYYPKQ